MGLDTKDDVIPLPESDANDELLGKRKHGVSSKDKNDELNGYTTYYGWY
mgnify:CR=1 FL=1